ncbi:MAG TPA: tRNA glutamyl-Q(34) synthetase GluQRS [Burkholderiales bacterium]|nr:tRNA glutamyl-Q(34) synthetase GluQRS [Burkholderiales bacterium]
MATENHVGRFAPSPTGPLHFGSVVAAAASYLSAKSDGGKWLLRIEDVDEGRTEPGSTSSIIRTIEELGMEWDGEILFQSERKDSYRDALERIRHATYPCSCSRRQIDGIYGGKCRNGTKGEARSTRVRVADETVSFVDMIRGSCAQNLEREVGDFVLFRADGYFSYQLAVVVDDHEQGVNQVVRGADLIDSTPRQIYLQRLLGYETPFYAHLPLALNEHGDKLSKQNLAAPAEPGIDVLFDAVEFLGQEPPAELKEGTIREFWKWALQHWKIEKIPKKDRCWK